MGETEIWAGIAFVVMFMSCIAYGLRMVFRIAGEEKGNRAVEKEIYKVVVSNLTLQKREGEKLAAEIEKLEGVDDLSSLSKRLSNLSRLTELVKSGALSITDLQKYLAGRI